MIKTLMIIITKREKKMIKKEKEKEINKEKTKT